MSDDIRAQISLSLGSNYILDRELEGAGSSRVFVAKELLTDRDVVVKVLSPAVSEGVSAERFAREVHLAGALQEPHTIPILSTGQTSGSLLYYIMPFVRADTLRQRLSHGPVGFDDAVTALRDVARAMNHAHRLGIVHKHIDPDKVFLFKNTAVIADFGLAKALEVARTDDRGPRLKLVGTSLGTPAYMAPEHATSDPSADHRADIYAWGVMAYEILSDGHPFGSLTSEEALLAAHVSEPAPIMLHKRYGVPEQLAVLVMRCLAKDPAERPSTAAELLTVLERIPLGSSTLVMESKAAARWIGASIALALALFVAGAMALWRLQSSESSEPPLVAILPFENNGVITDSLFAEGFEIAVSQRLAQLSALRIVDPASTHSFAKPALYSIESGKALGADFVLVTSLRWFHDVDGTSLVQISPVLRHVPDGKVRWTGSPAIVVPSEPFAVQAVLATQVAQALGVNLSTNEKSVLASSHTADTAAFRAFIIANRLYRDNDAASVEQYAAALTLFQRAYTLDPRYVDALGGAAMSFIRIGRLTQRADLLDSAARAARLTRALMSRQPKAMTASAIVSLARNRPEDAIARIDMIGVSTASDAEASAERVELYLLFRDSSTSWHEIQRLAAMAPRTPEALIVAADGAIALRRYRDAGAYLKTARGVNPNRADVALAMARLAKAEGRRNDVSLAIARFRLLGGHVVPQHLDLLRVGDARLQNELADSGQSAFRVSTVDDSIAYFTEKAKLFLGRKTLSLAQPLLDSSAIILQSLVDRPGVPDWNRREYRSRLDWIDAARGTASRSAMLEGTVDLSPALQRWRNGKMAARIACNGAEVFGFLGEAGPMVAQLRRCLTLPGGYGVNALATEPAFARYTTDPRVKALLNDLGLEDAPH